MIIAAMKSIYYLIFVEECDHAISYILRNVSLFKSNIRNAICVKYAEKKEKGFMQ